MELVQILPNDDSAFPCSVCDVRALAQRNKTLAKEGYGFCLKHEGRIPMAGCFCADWEQAKPESVAARETFWKSR